MVSKYSPVPAYFQLACSSTLRKQRSKDPHEFGQKLLGRSGRWSLQSTPGRSTDQSRSAASTATRLAAESHQRRKKTKGKNPHPPGQQLLGPSRQQSSEHIKEKPWSEILRSTQSNPSICRRFEEMRNKKSQKRLYRESWSFQPQGRGSLPYPETVSNPNHIFTTICHGTKCQVSLFLFLRFCITATKIGMTDQRV